VSPSVTAPGDTNPSDATVHIQKQPHVLQSLASPAMEQQGMSSPLRLPTISFLVYFIVNLTANNYSRIV